MKRILIAIFLRRSSYDVPVPYCTRVPPALP